MTIQLLIINSNISAAVPVTHALEQTRQFTVIPMAEGSAALDFLKNATQDIAIVDMHMPDYPGEELIRAIIAIQPDITVIAATTDSQMATRAINAGAKALLDGKYTAREAINIIQQTTLLNIDSSSSTKNQEEAALPVILTPQNNVDETVFNKIAEEEPPLPSFTEGGTVTDFMAQISGQKLENVLESLSAEFDIDGNNLPEFDDDDDLTKSGDTSDTPAKMIIEDTFDDTMPMDNRNFDAYLKQLRDEDNNNAQYIKEPDFLTDREFDDPFNQTTRPSVGELEKFVTPNENAETQTLYDHPPIVEVEAVSPSTEDKQETTESVESDTPESPVLEIIEESTPGLSPEDTAQQISVNDNNISTNPEIAFTESSEFEDPRIIQMAVSLTQASLESTAEAILLTRSDELIAYEGELSDTDIAELMQVILEKNETFNEQQSRIQFKTLSGNGLDYMIYSRRTDENFILSMIFGGKTPLKIIRQQGKKLATALESVATTAPEDFIKQQNPELTNAIVPTEPSKGGLRLETTQPFDFGPLTKYTFVWLLQDTNQTLSHAVAEAINSGLRVQLVEEGWHIEVVNVEGDYIYIVAGIPGDDPPQDIVRNLQVRAAKIAHQQDPTINEKNLWAESYFILSPGRELAIQEIQQYINFYRV